MKKIFLILALILTVFGLANKKVMAGGFNLKSIGGVDTSGRQISHWWYSGSSVIFRGEAMSGSTVTISIDGANGTTTAGSDNSWTYSAGTLTDGDHSVILTSDGSTIKFTLTTGTNNVDWDTVGKDASTSALPAAGVAFPTITLMAVGGSLIVLAKKISLR